MVLCAGAWESTCSMVGGVLCAVGRSTRSSGEPVDVVMVGMVVVYLVL